MEDVKLKSAKGILTLLAIKGLGPATAVKLIDRFDTLSQIVGCHPDDLKGLATAPIRTLLTEGGVALENAVSKAKEGLEAAAYVNASVTSVYDTDYPHRLSLIPDRPLVLYYSGDLSLLDRSVACVGTRAPTDFGSKVAERVTTMLGEAGWTIVSGLAKGVDAISHEAAIKCGAPTVAVLGSGIDTYASYAAQKLMERIEESGGLIMTEQPLGREADPSSLIRRNRIQTGSSLATFFMQADIESGTMHSVRYALLQGRPIFAPTIPDAFSDEELNRAAQALTGLDPHEFGLLIDAKPEIMQALEKLGRNSTAFAIDGKASYQNILDQLDEWLAENGTTPASPSM